jgi:mannose-6-phosphate isomerase-like protein (cupin superfamily)
MAKSRAQVQSASITRLGPGAAFILARAIGLGLALMVAATACTHPHRGAPRVLLDYGRVPIRADLDALLAANPLPPGMNILAVELGRTDTVSHHLVQVRGGEEPHVHQRHDLTVVMLRGAAVLTIDAEESAIIAGDTVFIPRGRAHFVRNAGRGAAVAFVIFSPAFQGDDSVSVGR